jgi:CBS domain-containing protein
MQAIDVMTTNVVSITAETTVDEIASLLLKHKISGVPVIDDEQQVIGVVSEGDLLRRVEGYSEARESWWLDLLSSPRNEAADFVKAKGRYARDIMKVEVISVDVSTPVGEIPKLLEKHHIKKVSCVGRGAPRGDSEPR